MEFAREKESLFDHWCKASKATDCVTLRELPLLEEFKNSLPEHLVVYLNEQKVTSLSHAAMLADEFVLTYKPFLAGLTLRASLYPLLPLVLLAPKVRNSPIGSVITVTR